MNDSGSTHPTLLIVDDDEIFCEVLKDALQDRGYRVESAHNIADGLEKAEALDPEYAVIDLRIGQESGLSLATQLHARDENTRMVILTGYASIATAVEAIKLGVTHYLAKPADADEILAALHKDEGDPDVAVSSDPISIKRLEWEHLQKVLSECNGNISAAARKLRMHRRTLQRKLAKRPVRE
ncbi:Dna binding response regulator PrrA (RegA) [hydrothermal vent metagenome]|uniref:Dna binding response regulator PrrA (RegA) n=1 Tax=hydrothermal vent metagenome TaxID=652676 RepID=A0A3B0YP03_9ZZZZ